MNELFPESELEIDASNHKKYKVEIIKDSIVYAKETKRHLPGLYHLISLKGYLKEESTWKPFSMVMHLWKMIFTFYKNHLEKATWTSFPLNTAPPIAKLSVKPSIKQKQGCPIGLTKQVTKWDIRQWSQWGFFFPILIRFEGFFTNSMSFKRDAHSTSSSNFASF